MEERKYTNYKFKVRKGSLGDFETEWWTDKDWERHHKYIEEIKADGTYGEEVEVNISLIHNPYFDDNKEIICSSYRMVFIDNGTD